MLASSLDVKNVKYPQKNEIPKYAFKQMERLMINVHLEIGSEDLLGQILAT